MKPLPFTVNVNGEAPALTDGGLRAVMAGIGPIGKEIAFVVVRSPIVTVIDAVPGFRMSCEGTLADSWTALMNVVVSAAPFHLTTAPFTNPEPFTDRVNPWPVAVAPLGLRLPIVGTIDPAWSIVNTVVETGSVTMEMLPERAVPAFADAV